MITIKKIDAADAREAIENVIVSYRHQLEIIYIVHEVLRLYHDKTYSKRISTAIEKELKARLPSQARPWVVQWGKNTSSYHVLIWGNGISYGKRMSLLLGYPGPLKDANHIFDFERYIAEYAPKFTQMENRIVEMESTLNDLAYLVADWNAAVAALELADKSFGYASHYITQ